MRAWILAALLVAGSACHGAAPPEFVSTARHAERLEVRAGVPRNAQAGANTRLVHGQKFYDHYLDLNDADRKLVADLVSQASTYAPRTDGKKCGGFHANYMVAWRREGALYQVMLCFSCREARVIGEGTDRYHDLTEDAYQALVQVLDRNNLVEP